jgi:hypothetical protein
MDDPRSHRPYHSGDDVAEKDEAMSNGENGTSGPQFRAGPLITSAALVGAGTLIALAGLAVGGTHLLTAMRQWIREMEVPPSELARQKWTQARAAVAAGAAAWQDGPSANPADDS